MKSLRRFRLRGGGGGDDDAEHDAPARNVSAGPLSAPFDEAAAANRGKLRFKHVLMNLGEGPQRQEGAGTGRRNSNANDAPHNNLRGGSERARRAKSPLLDTVRVSVVAPPSKSAPPSSPSSPTSLRRRGRARRKWDGPSRDNHRGLQQLQVQRRGGSSTTADTSDASSPRQRADAGGEKNLEVVPPSSLTRHLAAACDVMKEVNDGMMCHPNDVSGMTADTSFDDSRDGLREVATPRRHGGRPENSKVIAPGNAPVNVPIGRPEKAQSNPPSRSTGIRPEYDGDYDSALGWEAGQEVKLGGGGARKENVPRHDHDYRPLPPQRRSGKGKPAKSQKKERQKAQEEKQAKQKKEQQKKAQAAKGERSQSVPKTRVRSPPPAVTPSPPSATSKALSKTKEQKRTEQKVPGKQRSKSTLQGRQPPGPPPTQQQQPSQKQPPERPRPKSAPPRRPNTAVDAPASTTPSAAPTAKMANGSSKLLGRLLRRHKKPAMEPEEEGPGKARGEEEGGAEERVRVSVVYNSARSPAKEPTVPAEPPKVRRLKEGPKEGAMARQPQQTQQTQPNGQPGGRRPDPPAAYRHMHSAVEQPPAKGKKAPPAAQRHTQSFADPTAPSSTDPRPNPQNIPPQPERPAPPPPSKVKSHRRRPDRHETPPDEWTTPLPFKKVRSTPSNFSSFFTRQSSRSSQFWEGVEGFPDPARLFDNDIEEEGGEHVEMTREGAAEHFRRHAVDVHKEKLGATTPSRRGRTRRPRGSPRGSPGPPPSEVSNAFSLQLPLRDNGAFDDSDISALRMHDSATVYFQQQQQEGGREAGRDADTPESEYWKRKYDMLKEEMTKEAEQHHRSTAEAERGEGQRVALARKIDRRAEDRRTPPSTDARGSPPAGPAGASAQETHDEPTCDDTLGSMGETHDGTLRTDDHSIGETYDETLETDGDGTRTEWGRRCASPLDALHELWDGVVDLDRSEFDPPRCNDYHGGKRGRERAAQFAAQCSAGSGLTPRELDRIAAAARGRVEGAAVRCASRLEEARTRRGAGGDAPRYRSVCAATNLAEEGRGSARPSEASPPVDPERATRAETGTPETDEYDLRPAGYVPRDGTPTGSSLAHATEGENDMARPSHHRERRAGRPSSKALADDLTAGPSRLSLRANDATDDDPSELSANARLIFEAALPRGAHSGAADVRGMRGPQGRPRSVYSVARSPSKLSAAAAADCGATIPPDFASWFELPSPGTGCLPLLPLGDARMRNGLPALGVCDAEDVSSRVVADDAAALAFGDFCRAAQEMAGEGTTGAGLGEGVNVGPLVAEDEGAVRFADGAATLPDLSAAAVAALAGRRFEDAAAIYNALRRACQTSGSSRGIVGRLMASTLHNLSVLHLWNQEYDRALPCCREALRVKAEGGGDDAGAVRLWANLGLANYALGSFASALAAFRKAGQMASQYLPDDGALAGRLANNQAVVNFEIGKLPLVQSQFRRSLQLQRGTSSSPDDDADAEEDLFSISITIFNVGVVCARQAQHASAASHLKACLAIQQALLGGDDAVVRSTAHYLDSARRRAPAKSSAPGHQLGAKLDDEQYPPLAVMPAPDTEPTAHARGSNPRGAPKEQGTSNSQITAPSGRRPISHSKGAQESSRSQRQQVASRILKGAQSGPAGPGQTSQPMLSLGSLRAEATAAQRVQQSLEGCADSLALQGVGKGRHVSQLLCQRPAPVPTKQTISQSVLHFGLQTMKKREGEAELQRHLERYGPRHPLVGESHRRLGLFHLHAQNYPEAVAHLRSACRILGHALGEKHPDVASAVTFKGLAQLACERLDDALASFRQVRRLRENELGRRHPEMGRILNNLACVHYEMGDAARAEALLQEALDLQREVFTTEPAFLQGVSIVLCNIAFLHAKAGAFPKALIELEGALQIRQDILLEDNALDITKNMAHILAISQLQHGAVDLDEVTEEYVAMLGQSGTGR